MTDKKVGFMLMIFKVSRLISVKLHEQISHCCLIVCLFQLTQAQTGKFNVHVHVEYEWRLQNEDLDESEDEMEDKVGGPHVKRQVGVSWS